MGVIGKEVFYRNALGAAMYVAPFLPNVICFGTIVGLSSREAGQSFSMLMISSFGTNAATSQLAALDFWRGIIGFSAVVATITMLNLKHALLSASLWPHLEKSSNTNLAMIGFAITDSSWICCQMAIKENRFTSYFAIFSGWFLLIAWCISAAIGYVVATSIDPTYLSSAGFNAIAPLSMAVILPKVVEGSRKLVIPIGISCSVSSVLLLFGVPTSLSVLLSTFSGSLFVLVKR